MTNWFPLQTKEPLIRRDSNIKTIRHLINYRKAKKVYPNNYDIHYFLKYSKMIFFVLIEFIIWDKLILKPNCEIVSRLVDIRSGDENKIILVFSLEKTVEIPKDAIEKGFLNKLKGERIGLLNFNDQYKIRIIKKRIKDGKQQKNK